MSQKVQSNVLGLGVAAVMLGTLLTMVLVPEGQGVAHAAPDTLHRGSNTTVPVNDDFRFSPTYLFTGSSVTCPNDLDGNGSIGFDDLVIVLSTWGPCEGACKADLNGNLQVDFDDLVIILSTWDDTCE